MKKSYEAPRLLALAVVKEDILTLSLNENSLSEMAIPGVMWEG